MSKVPALLSFTFALPLVLFASMTSLFYHSYHKDSRHLFIYSPINTAAYAALPGFAAINETSIKTHDARIEMIRQFFNRYNSPLEPYAKDVVEAADTYGLDFRLIPAIAMQESTLCKNIPNDSHNCWGFGIYGKKVTKFDSYPEAITTVTRTLATKYKADGLHTPEEIMARYTPSSNGSWAEGVNFVISRLQ